MNYAPLTRPFRATAASMAALPRLLARLPRVRLLPLLACIGVALCAVFLGLIAATGSILFYLVIGAACTCFAIACITVTCRWTLPQLAFGLLLASYFGCEIVHKATGIALYGYWQFAVVFIGFWGVFALLRLVAASATLKWSFLAFAGFLLLVMASSLHSGMSTRNAALYQLMSDLKLPMTLAFGIYIASKVDVARALDRTILFYIPVVALFLALQWGSHGAYLAVFPSSRIPVELDSIFPSPGLSIFNHPSILAASAAALAIYVFTRIQVHGERSWFAWGTFFALVFLLFASNQRQETFAFVVVAAALYVVASGRGIGVKLLLSLLIFSVVTALYLAIFGAAFMRESSSWGIGSLHAATHPRAQLYEGAFYLAQQYFPLGTGLGTYGGVGSSKYDVTLFYKLGFARNWWWVDKESYLLDTYWPNSLAESGIFGSLLLLAHYLLLVFYALLRAFRSQVAKGRLFWFCAAASLLWVVLVSPTSPAFQEIRLLFFPALMLGIALAADKEKQHAC